MRPVKMGTAAITCGRETDWMQMGDKWRGDWDVVPMGANEAAQRFSIVGMAVFHMWPRSVFSREASDSTSPCRYPFSSY